MPRAFYDDSSRDGAWLDQRKWSLFFGSSPMPTIEVADGVTSFFGSSATEYYVFARSGVMADAEMVVRGFRRTDATAANRCRLMLHTDGGLQTPSGVQPVWGVGLNIEPHQVRLQKYVNATSTTLASPGNIASGTTAYDIRIQASGGRWKARVWASGGEEPGTWDCDVADSGDVPDGLPGLAFYRASPSVAAFEYESIEVICSALPALRAPLVFRDEFGHLIPYGKVPSPLRDDGIDSTAASWLTDGGGALSHDSATLARDLDVAGSSTVEVTGPVIPADQAEAIWLTLEGSRLSHTSAAKPILQLVGSAETYEFSHAPADSTAKLIAGSTTLVLPMEWVTNSEGPRHRNVSLLLLPRHAQLMALVGDQVLGHIDLPAAVTEDLTPTIAVTATTASARTLSWAAAELLVERN